MTDGILGAIGKDDIGAHFPPTDKRWQNAPSSIFLSHVKDLVHDLKGTIVNVDLTLICELPKIAPYRNKMRLKISEILDLSENRINIKATTTEKLGFTGRSEGICAHAVANVQFEVTGED